MASLKHFLLSDIDNELHKPIFRTNNTRQLELWGKKPAIFNESRAYENNATQVSKLYCNFKPAKIYLESIGIYCQAFIFAKVLSRT